MKHVLAHTKSNPHKPTHSVINVEKTKLLELLDEAWSTKGEQLPKYAAISFGNYGRVVGTAGEISVRIVVRTNTNKVITANIINLGYDWYKG